MMQALAHLFQIRCNFVESWQNYGVADSITCVITYIQNIYIYIFQSPVVLWAPHTTLCFCSSVRTSLRTLAQGMSSGHQMGLQLSFPQPGFPRPVEYFSISGMNARSWACKATKGAYNHCGSFNTGSGRAKHGLWKNKKRVWKQQAIDFPLPSAAECRQSVHTYSLWKAKSRLLGFYLKINLWVRLQCTRTAGDWEDGTYTAKLQIM